MSTAISARARKLLTALEAAGNRRGSHRPPKAGAAELAELAAADLIARAEDGVWHVSEAGSAFLARQRAATVNNAVDPFRAQHTAPQSAVIDGPHGRAEVTIDAAESPLAWLARRKGRDGAPLIAPEQFLAGERLRAEFTRAQMTPRVTSNWDVAVAGRQRGGNTGGPIGDTMLAARQRLRLALDAVGPEFAGLLLDVCCFLKGLEEVERERRWPARSAKVVLQRGLDRLARHYGLAREARGQPHATVRTWLAPGAEFAVDGV